VTLERVVEDLTGGTAGAIVSTVADDEVCATTPTSALVPHVAEYEGYMGNYGNTMDWWYRRAALVIWPHERAFAVRAEASPRWALDTLSERLRAGEVRESREMAASLAAFWGRVAGRAEENRGLCAAALRVAAGLESPRLATSLLLPFEMAALTPRSAPALVALIDGYGEGWARNLLDAWAGAASRGMSLGRRDVLTWLAALPPFCVALRSARGTSGPTAVRLVVQDGWRALQEEVAARRRVLPPSTRARALAPLARAIFGWLGGAAVAEKDGFGEGSSGAAAGGQLWIASAVQHLCGKENEALLPCLVELLRAATKIEEPARRGALGLDAIARHCGERLATLLATPVRASGDWSMALPAGCDCAICRRLGAFLADPAQPRLEWPLAKPGRQHVHLRIDGHELPVRHETRRAGSPYTLVLEKTASLFAQEAAARRRWQADLDWLASAGGKSSAISGN
jgi:hypothetical protein